MDVVSAARSLIADTLAFHLFFVLFGVALPALISGLEFYSIKSRRPRARELAHQWSRALVILFIAGAVSGTIVSLQFNLIWPTFTSFAGKVVGVSFALEGFAFLIEALFLTIYMMSWQRFKPWLHWLCSLPIVFGALASAFFITTVNAWMNTPRGFRLDSHGSPIDINTRQAVFNPAAGTEIAHSILAYFLATSLALLAIYAWVAWRRNKGRLSGDFRKVMVGLAGLALLFGLLVAFTGDRAGKFDAKYEPHKLAAVEGLEHTQSGAPLLVGGIVSGSHIEHAVRIPKFLSFLATGHWNGTVTGLNDIPGDQRPPVIVHYFFDAMVGIGSLVIIVTFLYLVFSKWRRGWANSRLMLILLVVCGFLGILAAEFGWMVTEFGRQPFVIRGVMRTSDAVTHSRYAIEFGYIFPILYLVLFVLTFLALKKGVNFTKVLK